MRLAGFQIVFPQILRVVHRLPDHHIDLFFRITGIAHHLRLIDIPIIVVIPGILLGRRRVQLLNIPKDADIRILTEDERLLSAGLQPAFQHGFKNIRLIVGMTGGKIAVFVFPICTVVRVESTGVHRSCRLYAPAHQLVHRLRKLQILAVEVAHDHAGMAAVLLDHLHHLQIGSFKESIRFVHVPDRILDIDVHAKLVAQIQHIVRRRKQAVFDGIEARPFQFLNFVFHAFRGNCGGIVFIVAAPMEHARQKNAPAVEQHLPARHRDGAYAEFLAQQIASPFAVRRNAEGVKCRRIRAPELRRLHLQRNMQDAFPFCRHRDLLLRCRFLCLLNADGKHRPDCLLRWVIQGNGSIEFAVPCVRCRDIEIVNGHRTPRLKPDTLPDPAVIKLSGVLREAGQRLLNMNVILRQAAVPVLIHNADDQCVFALPQCGRHAKAESGVSVFMAAQKLPVQPDLRAVVHRAEAEPPLFCRQLLHGEALSVPEHAVKGVGIHTVGVAEFKLPFGGGRNLRGNPGIAAGGRAQAQAVAFVLTGVSQQPDAVGGIAGDLDAVFPLPKFRSIDA